MSFSLEMIASDLMGTLKIPAGRRFGIIPRYRNVVLFLELDDDGTALPTSGSITVHAHTMYLGTLTSGDVQIDREALTVAFKSGSISFAGTASQSGETIRGTISLHDIDGVTCTKAPITFRLSPE